MGLSGLYKKFNIPSLSLVKKENVSGEIIDLSNGMKWKKILNIIIKNKLIIFWFFIDFIQLILIILLNKSTYTMYLFLYTKILILNSLSKYLFLLEMLAYY